jgi:hypothetical protein
MSNGMALILAIVCFGGFILLVDRKKRDKVVSEAKDLFKKDE